VSPYQAAVKPGTDIIIEEIKIEPEFSYDLERAGEDNYYPPYDDDFEISPDLDLGNAAEDQRVPSFINWFYLIMNNKTLHS